MLPPSPSLPPFPPWPGLPPIDPGLSDAEITAATWTLYSNGVWAFGCVVALVFLNMPLAAGTDTTPWLCRLLTVYLLAHTLSTVPQILGALPRMQGFTTDNSTYTMVAYWFILLAASTYFLIGTELLAPRKPLYCCVSCGIVAPMYLVAGIGCSLALLMTDSNAGMLLLFSYYSIAVAWACVGVIAIILRHRITYPKHCTLFALSCIAGIIDFLLPAIAYLGVNVWQPDFCGRLFDVLFYLPGVVITFRWLDRLPAVEARHRMKAGSTIEKHWARDADDDEEEDEPAPRSRGRRELKADEVMGLDKLGDVELAGGIVGQLPTSFPRELAATPVGLRSPDSAEGSI